MQLVVIIASTRPGRIGDQIGTWFADYAKDNSTFNVSVADLADINLPIFDEPNHPRTQQYTKDHTKKWSAMIDAADAFVVVTPEYNFTMPPSLLNAIDYLHVEWAHKPVGFVGYGGSGALRAIQTAKLHFSNMNVMAIPQGVNLMGVFAPEAFTATDRHEQAASTMLDELHAWSKALLPLHKKENETSPLQEKPQVINNKK